VRSPRWRASRDSEAIAASPRAPSSHRDARSTRSTIDARRSPADARHVARDGDDERERVRDVVSRASARRRARVVGRDANSRRRRSIETDDETDDAFVSRARR